MAVPADRILSGSHGQCHARGSERGMTTPTRSPRRRWTSRGTGPVPVRRGAPTSDPGPELALSAPLSSSPVELLPPPPIAGRAPPASATRKSEESRKRPVARSKRHASQRRAHQRKRGGERIRREGDSNFRSLFSCRHCGSYWSRYSVAPCPFF
jgi:hypothetical protein